MRIIFLMGFGCFLMACSTADQVVAPLDSLLTHTVSIPDPPTVPEGQTDPGLAQAARFLAGLNQNESSPLLEFELDTSWQDFHRAMNYSWGRMKKERLGPMEHWRDTVLSEQLRDSLTLFYPFSGPDFLHGQVFYPFASRYIMIGLEPVMELPPIQDLSHDDRNMLLDTLASSLRDIFGKSYFITTHMLKDFKKSKGILPVLFFFLERNGNEAEALEYFSLDTLGRESVVDFAGYQLASDKGIRLTFRNLSTGRQGEIFYFSADISDSGFKKKPGLYRFLQVQAPYNTFIKSASYLMHHNTFSTIRSLIVQNSETIFQDDTGVPYRYLRQDFNGKFYGEYVRPVADFKWLDKQLDLDSAFVAQKQPLPFSLGYHWNSRQQHYMLFLRK
ncbi:MAG: hypothetical protein FJZ78_11950 [Bacteroidetes bacterium]|nr:hypothetical protein [Bacteroidota bacterium]